MAILIYRQIVVMDLIHTYVGETTEVYYRLKCAVGRIGCQIQTPLSELQRVVPVKCVDLTVV